MKAKFFISALGMPIPPPPPIPGREVGLGVLALPLARNTRVCVPNPATGPAAAPAPEQPSLPHPGSAPRRAGAALSSPARRARDAASARIRRVPAPPPALPGAAGAQQAGRRQGGRGQARHPEKARAAGIRPMSRPGAAAQRRQECPARAQVASCPPPARPPGARTLERGREGPGPASS